MTTILAIDSSTGPCSVAIWSQNCISAYIEKIMPTTQASSLIPMIEQALAKSRVLYSDLTKIVSTTGPGSFTGIRIGLASAKGIAFSTQTPSAGYTTLDVLTYAAKKQGGNILAILNAGKGEYYYQHDYSNAQLGSLEVALATAGKVPVTVAGNIMVDRIGFTHCNISFPRADLLAEMAAQSIIMTQPLRPFYIRPPDAKLPTKILPKNN